MTHDLKILPQFYRAVLEERKTFEVRKMIDHLRSVTLLTCMSMTLSGMGDIRGVFGRGLLRIC